MTTSNLEEILQAVAAPTEEIAMEEVGTVNKEEVDNFIFKVVELSSYLFQLHAQAGMMHLNLESPGFIGLHHFLEEQCAQHLCDFNKMGKLVRSMDYLMPMCAKGLLGSYKNFSHVTTYEAKPSLIRYTKNLENGGYMGKDLVKMAEACECYDGAYEIACIINHMFTGAWKMKATLRQS